MATQQDDVEYLKNLSKDWWKESHIVTLVGRILDKYGYITDPWRFIEKPWTYQPLIDEFVKEWSP